MKKTLPKASVLILCCAFLLVSCRPGYTYEIPEQTNDGWQTASLDDVGLNEKILSELIERIHGNEYRNVHSILIVKDGRLVFEEYFSGYTWDYDDDQFRGEYTEFGINTIHNQASVTKAFTSALVGIAIDHGFIQDVETKVFAFFPEYSYLSDQEKDQITLEHLLTMTSGLEWNELDLSIKDARNDQIQLFIVPDPIEYVLAKPVVHEPGTRWYYSAGDVNLLGEVIRKATGLRMDDFAEGYLFAPLGITEYEWDFINPDVVHASGNLKLRPRDMAKFGYLYLNDGRWQGKRIISKEWIEESTQGYISIAEEWADSQGYQWFLKAYRLNSTSVDSFFRQGWGGQRISVFPSLDMVVVLTGGNYATEEPVEEIITRYILPAVQ